MSYSAAAAGPQLFDPGDFGDDEDTWADGAPPNWEDDVYNVNVASRGCCPNCKRRIPAEPLDVAIIDALPEGLVSRVAPAAAPISPPPSLLRPRPKISLFSHRGEKVLAVRVGTGNPAAGAQFINTVAYFVYASFPRRQSTLIIRFTVWDDPDHLVLLQPGEWDASNPTRLVTFDPLFHGLTREVRIARALKYISLANVPGED
jgi:hypothetical protein